MKVNQIQRDLEKKREHVVHHISSISYHVHVVRCAVPIAKTWTLSGMSSTSVSSHYSKSLQFCRGLWYHSSNAPTQMCLGNTVSGCIVLVSETTLVLLDHIFRNFNFGADQQPHHNPGELVCHQSAQHDRNLLARATKSNDSPPCDKEARKDLRHAQEGRGEQKRTANAFVSSMIRKSFLGMCLLDTLPLPEMFSSGGIANQQTCPDKPPSSRKRNIGLPCARILGTAM
eukprot:1124171-Amphidinium_carterae.1